MGKTVSKSSSGMKQIRLTKCGFVNLYMPSDIITDKAMSVLCLIGVMKSQVNISGGDLIYIIITDSPLSGGTLEQQ